MVRSPTRIVNTSLTYLILRLSHRRPEGRLMSGRNASAAASWLAYDRTLLTVCSTSSKVPGKREQKKSGSRLMVWRFPGQYHLAIRQYSGNFLG